MTGHDARVRERDARDGSKCLASGFSFAGAPKSYKQFDCVDMHCAGMPARIIMPSKSLRKMWDEHLSKLGDMQAVLDWLNENAADLRSMLFSEPRGAPCSCGAMLFPSKRPDADAGMVIAFQNSYVPMCGHVSIATVSAMLQQKLVDIKLEAEDTSVSVSLDTAAGLVTLEGTVDTRGGEVSVRHVKLVNVVSFCIKDRVPLRVGSREISVGIAFGGLFYCIVDNAEDLVGEEMKPERAGAFAEFGIEVKRAAVAQLGHLAVHPEKAGLCGIDLVMLRSRTSNPAEGFCRSTVVMESGNGGGILDRSPCGTGTSALLSLLHRRGELAAGKPLRHRSILDTEFIARIEEVLQTPSGPRIRPSITGTAYMAGLNTLCLDPRDPFPSGYKVGDLWR
eukprot:Hpha_TRINITY_DN31690_c0_g1::TRINITY_DN31690_c0_g1_i1::g.29125::m.29125/K01777/prdF; proline racemase